jgi:hypothetical protein
MTVIGVVMSPLRTLTCALLVPEILADANGDTMVKINNYYRRRRPGF